MTIQDLGSIGELVAAAATVATLLYLALQIRQSVSATRANIAASQNQGEANISLFIAQDEELNRIYFDGLAEPSKLSERDERRFGALLNAQLANSEANWRYYRDGWLEQELWSAQLRFLAWVSKQPGFTRFWAVWKPSFAADFAHLVEEQASNETEIPSELPAAQQAAAADRP